ncbi:uncharacterized protein SPAPADRAFT_144342, partial [Spathaspora passalidarum NRRL Y-27907]
HSKHHRLDIPTRTEAMLHSIRHYSAAAAASAAATANLTHYQLLDIPRNATLKEIKLQFKKLTKQYHPDLNQHLSAEERESNSATYVKMVDAYTVLKDVRKRREYDLSLKSQGSYSGGDATTTARYKQSDWHSKYYGEAKYYSRSGNSYTTASGYNTRRHRVRYDHGQVPEDNNTGFHGKHRNYGDRYDVPHFDYDEHLNRNLKFEQRLIDKRLDSVTKEKILAQLAKSGLPMTEEVKTKHLLRQAQVRSSCNQHREYMYYTPPSSQNFYQSRAPPPNEGPSIRTFVFMSGGGFSLYLLYKLIA